MGKLNDMTGQTVGDWKVLGYAGHGYWECQCSKCGRIKEVRGSSLRSGESTSCGCISKKLIDMVGKRVGSLVVLERDLESPAIKPYYICQCDCGSIVSVSGYRLRKELTKDCRSKRHEYWLKAPLNDESVIEKEQTTQEEKQCIDYIESLTPYKVERTNREVLSGMELDAYIPELKIAIKFNGNYWHSTKHVDRLYHQNKTINCAKKGIQLIHIFEYEWLNPDKQEIIKKYLADIIRTNGLIRVYARNTVIEHITKEEAEGFLNANHLQGNSNTTIRYGLRYKGELVQVMTFGKPRFNTECEYELIRLCTLSGHKVIGGAERLFKHFLREYNPNTVISYCDIAKFTGGIYGRLGFTANRESLTSPNYVWASKNEVLSRYQTQKHKLIKHKLGTEEQTEDEIMDSLGYLKVYDSGNMRYIWNKK